MGHLISRMADQPENWAIESLHYLLSGSQPARDALVRLLGRTGVALPTNLRFTAQVTGEDQARPDIEGMTDGGDRRVILEAKFWAPLTAHQPVTYLKRLPEGQPSILAFAAPSTRFSSLWPELMVRCRDAQMPLTPSQQIASDYWHAQLPSGHQLALISWRAVLTEIKRALEVVQDHGRAEDAKQLMGLCDRMDEAVFLPLHADDLTAPNVARRHRQFELLAKDKIPQAALAEGICTNENRLTSGSTGKLQASSGDGYAGHYLRLSRIQVLLSYDWLNWSRFGQSPLWLRFDQADKVERRGFEAARNCLATLRSADPPRLIEEPGSLLLPLLLPLAKEEHEVIRHVLDQLKEIGAMIETGSLQVVS